eukprot:gene16875-biopygen6797
MRRSAVQCSAVQEPAERASSAARCGVVQCRKVMRGGSQPASKRASKPEAEAEAEESRRTLPGVSLHFTQGRLSSGWGRAGEEVQCSAVQDARVRLSRCRAPPQTLSKTTSLGKNPSLGGTFFCWLERSSVAVQRSGDSSPARCEGSAKSGSGSVQRGADRHPTHGEGGWPHPRRGWVGGRRPTHHYSAAAPPLRAPNPGPPMGRGVTGCKRPAPAALSVATK